MPRLCPRKVSQRRQQRCVGDPWPASGGEPCGVVTERAAGLLQPAWHAGPGSDVSVGGTSFGACSLALSSCRQM